MHLKIASSYFKNPRPACPDEMDSIIVTEVVGICRSPVGAPLYVVRMPEIFHDPWRIDSYHALIAQDSPWLISKEL